MYRKIIGIFIIYMFLVTSFSNISSMLAKEKISDKINETFNNILTSSKDIQKLNEIQNYKSTLKIESFFTSLDNTNRYDSAEQDSMLYSCGYSVKETNDNGFIICGATGTLNTQTGFLLKTDSQGYMIWNKTFLIQGNTICFSVEQTIDGGYIITGGTSDTYNGNTYAFLYKTDNIGNNIWNKTYNILNHTMGITIKQAIDGEYMISGITGSDELNDYNAFLIKTDSSGKEIWIKKYEYNVFFNDFDQTADGGYIIGGTIAEISPPYHYKYYPFLLKTDEYGNETWYKTFKISNYTIGYSVIQTQDSGYVLSGVNGQGGFLLKTNNQGVEIWNKSYLNRFSVSLEQTSDNCFITGGVARVGDKAQAFLLKTDESGNKIWDKTYKCLEETQVDKILLTKQGDIILTGMTSEEFIYQDSYIVLLKTDSKGDQQWYRIFNITGVLPGYIKFYGWDISNTNQELHIHIGSYGYNQGSSRSIGYYETDYIELCPGNYLYKISWSGKESKSSSIQGFVNIRSNEYLEIIQNLTFSDDLPEVSIIKPDRAVYINNKKIIPFFVPLVVGDIDILVNVSDNSSGIDYVDFYIDDEYQFNDLTEPYIWQYNEKSFGIHTIKIVAVDKVGYENSCYMEVIKFF